MMTEQGSGLIVPARGRHYTGILKRKPWDYQLTVAIPHIETPEMLRVCVALLRCQTMRPYILIIDTGSTSPESLATLADLAGEDCEAHYLRSHGWRHASEPVAVAMDLAMCLCRTREMITTHADCFLTARAAVEDLYIRASLGGSPFAGYRLTDRDHWRFPDDRPCKDYRWMLGHTFSLIDVGFCRANGIQWDLSAGCRVMGWEWGTAATPNIVDTEVFFNYGIRDCGIDPLIIGEEKNYQRNRNAHFDHVRSAPSAQLYLSPQHELRKKQDRWKKIALREARGRLREWGGEETA